MATNSYGVNLVPDGAKFGLYDPSNGEWTGKFFDSLSAAQAFVDDGDFDVDGEDGDGWYVVAVNGDDSNIIVPSHNARVTE